MSTYGYIYSTANLLLSSDSLIPFNGLNAISSNVLAQT